MDLNRNLFRIEEAISLMSDRPEVDPAVLNKGLDLVQEIIERKRLEITARSVKATEEAFEPPALTE